MKMKVLLIVVLLAVFAQESVFAKGIVEERSGDSYEKLAEKVNACINNGDYAAAIPLLKLMHEIKPEELAHIENLGIFYFNLPEERPALNNVFFWLSEAEKCGSYNFYVYYNLACLYSFKGDVEKAIEEMDKAVALGYSDFEWMSQDDDLDNFRNSHWWEGIADNYTQIEQQLAQFSEFAFNENKENITDRLIFYGSTITTLKKLALHISALQCRPLSFLANLHYAIGDYAKAEPYYLELRNIYEQTLGEIHPLYAISLNNLGNLYQNMGDYVNAQRYYLEAKAVRERTLGKNHPDYALSLNNLGSLYHDIGDYVNAQRYYMEAATVREQALGKNHPDYALSLNNLGVLYHDIGDYAKAETYYMEAKIIYEQVLGKNHPSYASSLNNLGSLYHDIGDYAKAELYYLESKTVKEQTLGKNHPSYTTSLNNLAALYHDMGDYARAELYYLESKNVREQTLGKNHPDYAISLSNLGSLYQNMGDYSRAESYYLETKIVREQVLGKDHPDYAVLLNNLGALYQDMGDYSKAEPYYLEAMSVREKTLGKNHPDYATSLNNLGVLYQDMGDYFKAEPYYLESKNIREQTLGKNHPDYALSLNNLGLLYRNIENYAKAEACNKELCELRINLINQNFLFMSQGQRGLYLETVSHNFESSYSLSWMYPVETVNGLNYTNTLFIKGLLLRTTNAVRDAIYSSGNAELIEKFEQLGNIRLQINQLRQKEDTNEAYLQSLEEQADALDKEITRASSAFRDIKTDMSMSWQIVRSSLKRGEAAIEFVSFKVYDKKWTDIVQYAALVLKHDSKAPVWIPLCNEGELKEILGKAEGKNSSEQARILYNANGLALFETIWKPLEKELKGVKIVYYSPSGLLHKIAFNALPIDDSFNKRLTDKYNLNLVSSTREITSISRNKKDMTQITSAVLYGGLDYNADENAMRTAAQLYKKDTDLSVVYAPLEGITRGGEWVSLPATRVEVQNIQNFLARKKIPNTLYQDNMGNEESFKQLSSKKTGLIHLATHGFFLTDIERKHDIMEQQPQQRGSSLKPVNNPLLRSGILLAGGNHAWTNNPVEGVETGILTADKIAGMNLLGAKLVVMSACQTGLGDVKNGEGVFGLQRSFKLAGVETLIMSLWEVSDEATALLMSTFYNEWLISGKSRQESFKEAQKKVRAKYSAPFYWAAFVMMD